MSGLSDDSHLSRGRFLAQLHPQCRDRHGNLTFPGTTPNGSESSTGDAEAENTDFGAVMYITAVLVFYSLGIVVMIVKYLKTERKELEQEMALESFFKGIPSKKMEHNRDAVNRVAIRAFHTLTSGAKRQDQLLMTAHNQATADLSPTTQEPRSETSPHTEDSDSSRGDPSPYLLQREPSKYLPRVSLIFRDNRANDRRRTYDTLRTGLTASLDDSLPSGQRRGPAPASTPPLQENGRAGFCSRVPAENSDHSDDSLASLTNICNSDSAKTQKRRENNRKEQSSRSSTVVTFVDEKRARGKSASRSKVKDRAKNSKSSQGHFKPKPAIKLYAPAKDIGADHPNTSTRGLDHANTSTRGVGHANTFTRGVDHPGTSANSVDNANKSTRGADHPHTSTKNVDHSNMSTRCLDHHPHTSTRGVDHAVHKPARNDIVGNGAVSLLECPPCPSSGSLPTQVTVSDEQGVVSTTVTPQQQQQQPGQQTLQQPPPKGLLVSDV